MRGPPTWAPSAAKRRRANTAFTQNPADEALQTVDEIPPATSEMETIGKQIQDLASLVSTLKAELDTTKAQITTVLARRPPGSPPEASSPAS